MKKPIILLVLLAAVGGGVWTWMRRSSADDDKVIRISGNMEMTQVDVAFKTAGRLIELNTDEGQMVKKGMVLARIDKETVERQRTRDMAGVTSAESQLTQLRTLIQWQSESVQRELELRGTEVRTAESKLKDLLAGSRPQEILASRAAVDEAKAQLTQAKKDWERAQVLYKNEDISTAQYDQYQARFNALTSAVKQARGWHRLRLRIPLVGRLIGRGALPLRFAIPIFPRVFAYCDFHCAPPKAEGERGA